MRGKSRGNGSVFQITGKFKITEFKLARSNCILRRTPASTVRSNKCIWQLMLSQSGKTPISGENPKRRKASAAVPSESDVNVDMSDTEEKEEDFKDCEKGA